MRTCLTSPEATEDLDEIFDYFASKNVEAGERFVITFEKKDDETQQIHPYWLIIGYNK